MHIDYLLVRHLLIVNSRNHCGRKYCKIIYYLYTYCFVNYLHRCTLCLYKKLKTLICVNLKIIWTAVWLLKCIIFSVTMHGSIEKSIATNPQKILLYLQIFEYIIVTRGITIYHIIIIAILVMANKHFSRKYVSLYDCDQSNTYCGKISFETRNTNTTVDGSLCP